MLERLQLTLNKIVINNVPDVRIYLKNFNSSSMTMNIRLKGKSTTDVFGSPNKKMGEPRKGSAQSNYTRNSPSPKSSRVFQTTAMNITNFGSPTK